MTSVELVKVDWPVLLLLVFLLAFSFKASGSHAFDSPFPSSQAHVFLLLPHAQLEDPDFSGRRSRQKKKVKHPKMKQVSLRS